MPRKKNEETGSKKPTTRRNTTTTKRKTTPSVRSVAAESVTNTPVVPCTEAQIRERAYFIYLKRGGAGDPLSDWLQAERELNRGTIAIGD
jgi:hypothetical protein